MSFRQTKLAQLIHHPQTASSLPLRCLGAEASGYRLSYADVLVNFLPFASVPLTMTVRVLPSGETTMRPVMVTLPSFLLVNANAWSSIFVYDRASELESPVTG